MCGLQQSNHGNGIFAFRLKHIDISCSSCVLGSDTGASKSVRSTRSVVVEDFSTRALYPGHWVS